MVGFRGLWWLQASRFGLLWRGWDWFSVWICCKVCRLSPTYFQHVSNPSHIWTQESCFSGLFATYSSNIVLLCRFLMHARIQTRFFPPPLAYTVFLTRIFSAGTAMLCSHLQAKSSAIESLFSTKSRITWILSELQRIQRPVYLSRGDLHSNSSFCLLLTMQCYKCHFSFFSLSTVSLKKSF